MSSNVLLRLPADLKQQLKDEAAHQGVSMNTLSVALIAGGLHFEVTPTNNCQEPEGP